MVLAISNRCIGMGTCMGCKHAGPIGMECTLCKQAFLIMTTKLKECGDEDRYNWFWPDACVSPLEMVKLMHPDLYHDQCVHDGEDLPLCSELAARVDDEEHVHDENRNPDDGNFVT